MVTFTKITSWLSDHKWIILWILGFLSVIAICTALIVVNTYAPIEKRLPSTTSDITPISKNWYYVTIDNVRYIAYYSGFNAPVLTAIQEK